MKNRIHGILSLFIFGIAIIIGIIPAFRINLFLGLGYIFLLTVSSIVMIFAFCSKCPCNKNCMHVLPGLIIKRTKTRTPGQYNWLEIGIVVTSILLIIGIPQLWLWNKWNYFFLFWILTFITFLEIRFFVCKKCSNNFCPVKMIS